MNAPNNTRPVPPHFELVCSLRELADFYARNPTARPPSDMWVREFVSEGGAPRMAARARELGGQWEQSPEHSGRHYYGIQRRIGAFVYLLYCDAADVGGSSGWQLDPSAERVLAGVLS